MSHSSFWLVLSLHVFSHLFYFLPNSVLVFNMFILQTAYDGSFPLQPDNLCLWIVFNTIILTQLVLRSIILIFILHLSHLSFSSFPSFSDLFWIIWVFVSLALYIILKSTIGLSFPLSSGLLSIHFKNCNNKCL